MTSLVHSPRGSRAALEVPSNPGLEIRGEEAEQAREPTLADIMAAVTAVKAAGEQQIAVLQAELQQLRSEAAMHGVARPGVHSLEHLCSVHHFPTSVSDAHFSVRELARLPTDVVTADTVPMLDIGQHPLALAAAKWASEKKTDGAGSALRYELPPLLTVQSVGLMTAAVMKQILADLEAQTLDFDTLVRALSGSLSYLIAWSNRVLAVRVNEIATLLQYDAAAAAKWASMQYGPQNTLLDDSPAAVAFRLMQATEPAPPRSANQVANQADRQTLGRGRGAGGRARQQQQQQGRGRGRTTTGGYQPPPQQQSKGGAEKATPPTQ